MEIVKYLLLLVVGFAFLVKGADWFVEGASGIAEKFGIPQLVIGLTIVAMGTSMPEAAVSISAALKGSAGITIGNVVGSNILNILIILGLSALVAPLAVQQSTVRYEIPFVLLVTLVLLGLGYDGNVGLIDGIILWALFIVYFIYLIRMSKQDSKDNPEEGADDVPEKSRTLKLWQAILLTIIGLVLIVAGSEFAVDGATGFARLFGVSERVIGLTIVALGTSLPELFTSVSASMKGNADIAIGNIVGSNIFNILFVVGTSALIIPVTFQKDFIFDTIVAAGAAILLFICCFKDQKLYRWGGVLMLVAYAAYFVTLL
ncbi:MAG: calcium/sodium antiporter [Lachnospiraceae bacterium]|nr:calcium/sodium antiporter [Lachnospiraceae bacterium]